MTVKSSQAISLIKCLYWTNVSRTILVIVTVVIRDQIPDDDDQDGPQKVSSIQTPDSW